MATANSARPAGPLSTELLEVTRAWARSQQRIVTLSVDFAESSEWVLAGSATPAHWLADIADVEVSTAREWIRIGRQLRELPAIAAAFAAGEVSYSKVRTLTRIATAENEEELLGIAKKVPAGELGRALARWLDRNSDPEELDEYQRRRRSVRWRTEPDGMTLFTLRLPPLVAAAFIAYLTAWVMKSRRRVTMGGNRASAVAPTVAQQHADAVEDLLTNGGGETLTEIVLHVRGDGCTLDDGSPIPGSVVERIAPESFLRALIHDAESKPRNGSGRQRHPNARQKRVVKERDQVCVDCGRRDLLQYDHDPPFEESQQTVIEELVLRCAPCHWKRHAA